MRPGHVRVISWYSGSQRVKKAEADKNGVTLAVALFKLYQKGSILGVLLTENLVGTYTTDGNGNGVLTKNGTKNGNGVLTKNS